MIDYHALLLTYMRAVYREDRALAERASRAAPGLNAMLVSIAAADQLLPERTAVWRFLAAHGCARRDIALVYGRDVSVVYRDTQGYRAVPASLSAVWQHLADIGCPFADIGSLYGRSAQAIAAAVRNHRLADDTNTVQYRRAQLAGRNAMWRHLIEAGCTLADVGEAYGVTQGNVRYFIGSTKPARKPPDAPPRSRRSLGRKRGRPRKSSIQRA